jgi:hypothetical protein
VSKLETCDMYEAAPPPRPEARPRHLFLGGRLARRLEVAQNPHRCSAGNSVVDTVLPVGRKSITAWVVALILG